ncbi:hypothetical protein SK128_002853 [Halocaridina rubra]|uniref:Uncharacterized protein n=1 Tax=Halocaridina rubra TaxID=373956 RepID=A0AAN8WW74_HALRR
MIHIYCIENMHYLSYVGCPRCRVDSQVAKVGALSPTSPTPLIGSPKALVFVAGALEATGGGGGMTSALQGCLPSLPVPIRVFSKGSRLHTVYGRTTLPYLVKYAKVLSSITKDEITYVLYFSIKHKY